MGTTTKTISFFSDEITIRPHSASKAEYLDRAVTLREFAAGRPITLEQITSANNPDTIGEYIARAGEIVRNFRGLQFVRSDDFIAGPEA